MKRRARRAFYGHYFIYAAVCLIAGFIGTEFAGSLDSVTYYSRDAAEEQGAFFAPITDSRGMADVMTEILEGRTEEGRALSEQLEQEAISRSETGNPMLGRTRGVLSKVVNGITSGSFLVTIAEAVQSAVGSENLMILFFVGASFALSFCFWCFLENMFTVVSRRFFLEGRMYEKVSIQRFVYLLRVKKWLHVSWVMLVKTLFQTLWGLTVIGGFIKHYSYFLVPYILAENPGMGALEAISLSRRMMKGHKWQCFVFELSFLGWYLLGMVTFRLSELFYSNPYKVAAFSEFYSELRRLAKENNLPGAEALNDRYLFVRAEPQTLRAVYADVYEAEEEPEVMELHGVRGFFANWFGIIFSRSETEREYERQQARRIRADILKDAAEGYAYPGRLHPVPEEEKRKKIETLQYVRHYTVWSLILMFFCFSLIGWIWEVSLHFIMAGKFVNRGVLHGPWLPIYGSGGVLILLLLYRLRRKPVLEFISAVTLCGIVEYFTAYYLETVHGMKWWDYSGYFLNLHGRICAEGLLVFGIGGMAIVYVLAPMLDNLFRRIPGKITAILCAGLMSVFLVDLAWSSVHPNSGKGVAGQAAGDTGAQVGTVQDSGGRNSGTRNGAPRSSGARISS